MAPTPSNGRHSRTPFAGEPTAPALPVIRGSAAAGRDGIPLPAMIVREIFAKTILSKSAIQDYALNAYVGCEHNCRTATRAS